MKNIPESLPNKLAANEDDSAEKSVSSLKFKTPAKRTISGVKIGNININLIKEEGQNSTNRLRSKGTEKLKSRLSDSD
ncbi:hypothetical protein HN51_022789, partial [Arachis hypogaea]